jgi:hypothetical protein
MRNSPDPSLHRQREQTFVEHVERLLSDDRLRVDTVYGRRPVASLRRDVRKDDHEVELKRLMAEVGVPDRVLQAQMPLGRELTVTLSRPTFLLFNKTVGRIKVVSVSPTRELLDGQAGAPLSPQELKGVLSQRLQEQNDAVPSTVVVLSTSGFALESRDLVERGAARTLILVEPNEAGGWTVTGPAESRALVDLFDPEVDDEKRRRIRQEIERCRADLLHGGLGADRIASATKLPMQLVEQELRFYAGENEGLVAKRLEGNVVLFRDGSVAALQATRSGSNDMPFIDRVKALFSRKGDNEKKLAFLSERRAALSMQRDRAFDEMGVLEQKEAEMRQQFKDTTSSITKRRITSHLLQLRKDLERRQQLLGVLNQQINVVSTHLHNLELVSQGQSAALPTSEEMAEDAAHAEEVLAELQASTELAGSIGATGATGLTDEEQALYDELEREATGESPTDVLTEAPTPTRPTAAANRPRQAERETPPPLPNRTEPRRSEPEPG